MYSEVEAEARTGDTVNEIEATVVVQSEVEVEDAVTVAVPVAAIAVVPVRGVVTRDIETEALKAIIRITVVTVAMTAATAVATAIIETEEIKDKFTSLNKTQSKSIHTHTHTHQNDQLIEHIKFENDNDPKRITCRKLV